MAPPLLSGWTKSWVGFKVCWYIKPFSWSFCWICIHLVPIGMLGSSLTLAMNFCRFGPWQHKGKLVWLSNKRWHIFNNEICNGITLWHAMHVVHMWTFGKHWLLWKHQCHLEQHTAGPTEATCEHLEAPSAIAAAIGATCSWTLTFEKHCLQYTCMWAFGKHWLLWKHCVLSL